MTASAALIAEARAWMADCVWREDPDDLADMSDRDVLRSVNRHYEGGLDALARNSGVTR